MAEKLNFTKARLEAIQPASKRTYYLDTRDPKLGLYVTPTGIKTFFARLRIDGKTVRYPVGRFPDLSIPSARDKARKAATGAAEGINPVAAKRRQKASRLTLREVLESYLQDRDLKPRTITDYKQAIDENYSDWLDKPLAEITEKQMLNRYLERGKVSKARTDNGYRVLKAIFRYAYAKYKDSDGYRYFQTNPTDIVTEAKVRYKPQRRRRMVRLEDLTAWWTAVHTLNNKVSRDLMVFTLLTGTRKTEASSLRWEHVDLKNRIFTLIDTKNRRVIELPLPEHMVQPFITLKGRKKSGWVFPAKTGKTGYLADPRKSIGIVKTKSGIEFSLHDLRRTFVSTANGLDINTYTVKALVNHKINSSDVTAGYDVPEMDRLRAASAKIEDKLLRAAGVKSAKVVQLRQSNG